MVTITRSASGASREIAVALESVVRDVLADAPGPLEVQFGTWPAEDGRTQFLCRVEAPPAVAFGDATQWRWWSPLVDGPEQLREVLSAAVARRGWPARTPSTDVRSDDSALARRPAV
jgi:hypothetical protein